jgi:serine/threonine protein kinase
MHPSDLELPGNASFLAFGVASVMRKLHKHNIIHGNLKSSNALLSSDFRPVVSDFGDLHFAQKYG